MAVAVAVSLALSACGGENRRTAEESGNQGVTDEDILIGGSFPFSGVYSAFANGSKGAAAYFAAINADGGVNGRQIVYTAVDDGYDPARLAANARAAVEEDGVAAFLSFGGPNVAIQQYMNEQEIPQIVLAGNTEFGQVDTYPYTHAWWPDLTWEAEYTTDYVLENPEQFPDPRIGLIGLSNTLGDSHIAGTVAALGDRAEEIFPSANRLRVEPTLADWTSQLNQLRAAGVTVLYMDPGTAGQVNALKYIEQTGWDVAIFLYSAGANIKQMTEPAGPEASTGLYAPAWLKDPADPRWTDDEGVQRYRDIIEQYGDDADADQALTANGYGAAQALVTALEAVGDEELTPAAINEAWLAIDDVESDVLMPGSTMSSGPGGRLVYSYQMVQFDGTSWQDVAPLADMREMGIAE
jgi:branched-chain amino acid transport system substrate-binding protein